MQIQQLKGISVASNLLAPTAQHLKADKLKVCPARHCNMLSAAVCRVGVDGLNASILLICMQALLAY